MVETKTNEIPVVRQLFQELDLRGRFVSLDALHTQTETGREVVLQGVGVESAFTQQPKPKTSRAPDRLHELALISSAQRGFAVGHPGAFCSN